jgi:hypothetical protein
MLKQLFINLVAGFALSLPVSISLAWLTEKQTLVYINFDLSFDNVRGIIVFAHLVLFAAFLPGLLLLVPRILNNRVSRLITYFGLPIIFLLYVIWSSIEPRYFVTNFALLGMPVVAYIGIQWLLYMRLVKKLALNNASINSN